MRFFSLIILVVAMWWTFTLNRGERDLSVNNRGLILRELQESMIGFLQDNVEGIQNIRFLQAYTRTVRPGEQIVAYFKYSYEAPTPEGQLTKETRDGEFDLKSQDGGKTWEPKALNFRDLSLEFLEDLTITSEPGGASN